MKIQWIFIIFSVLKSTQVLFALHSIRAVALHKTIIIQKMTMLYFRIRHALILKATILYILKAIFSK